MGSHMMTRTLLWVAISAAYLVYCEDGSTPDDQASQFSFKSQTLPYRWRRHLHQQVLSLHGNLH